MENPCLFARPASLISTSKLSSIVFAPASLGQIVAMELSQEKRLAWVKQQRRGLGVSKTATAASYPHSNLTDFI